MGNKLYQSSDNKSTIRGNKTARSFAPDPVVTSKPKLKKGGGCGCGKR